MSKILIVDDEKAIRATLKEILEYENFKVDEAADGVEGLEMLRSKEYDAVLCDIKMANMDGEEFLNKAMEEGIITPIIMITAHGDFETAIKLVEKGAWDFLSKPLDLNRIRISLRNAITKAFQTKEIKTLKRKISKTFDIVGESEAIKQVKETIEMVAPTEARVLITGPNGTGKELVAKWIHEKSERSGSPLVEINCAAIPAELIESELFGHEKGAFTSAVKQRIGKFEQANGGTLFLDEIGDMSLSAQSKVLRALQEHKITRVGGDKEIKVNVRVIAATNKDLKKEIEANKFREDLYHRLGVILIQVPPLKDRLDDIPLLIDKFLGDIAAEYGWGRPEIESAAIKELQKKEWTGNIRELRNVVERLMILSPKKITLEAVKKFVG